MASKRGTLYCSRRRKSDSLAHVAAAAWNIVPDPYPIAQATGNAAFVPAPHWNSRSPESSLLPLAGPIPPWRPRSASLDLANGSDKDRSDRSAIVSGSVPLHIESLWAADFLTPDTSVRLSRVRTHRFQKTYPLRRSTHLAHT